jgi:hypothetical protein
MEANQPDNSLFEVLRRKSQLKQDVYQITHNTFRLFKNVILEMVADYQQKYNGSPYLLNTVTGESLNLNCGLGAMCLFL